MIQISKVYDVILDSHQRLQHTGYIKTFNLVRQRFYGIARQEVVWLLKHCNICCQNRPSNTKAPLEPIQSHYTLERVQIDLVDMRANPHANKLWILHLKDHFSKASFLYALPNKTAEEVAKCMGQWIGMFGVPKIIQCDNGTEFKGVLLILLKKYGIKILNGRPRHPQTQGLVEQANGVMKAKLRCWLEEHPGCGWTDALPDITLAINRQSHTTLGGKMPYEVFYNRKPRWEDRIPVDQYQCVKANDVDDEILDIATEALWKVQQKANRVDSDMENSSVTNSDDDVDDFLDLSEVNLFSVSLNKYRTIQ